MARSIPQATSEPLDTHIQKTRHQHGEHSLRRHTAQISTGGLSHRAIISGADESGMGRWSWTLYMGKNDTKLRVISGYRPNPDYTDRPGSVYSQQERSLREREDDRNPRKAFTQDLAKDLDAWTTAGNLIILVAWTPTTTFATEKSIRCFETADLWRSMQPDIHNYQRHPPATKMQETSQLTAFGLHRPWTAWPKGITDTES